MGIADHEERIALGRRLRRARESARLRVADIAETVDRLVITVYRWEEGKSEPSVRACRLIAIKTGCSIAWLITGEGEMARAA